MKEKPCMAYMDRERLNPFLIRATFESITGEPYFSQDEGLNPFLIRATFESNLRKLVAEATGWS